MKNFLFSSAIGSLLLAVAAVGCKDSTGVPPSNDVQHEITSRQYRDELLSYAIDNLNRLAQFESSDAIQQIAQRLDPRRTKPRDSADRLTATWIEPEMLRQIVDRLNQWIRPQTAPADWKPDPMIGALPKRLAELPELQRLDRLEFSRFDGFVLQGTVWLRDVSRWARGDSLNELEQAKSLFDWTVRNIQLDADSAKRIPQFPREVLLFGHGTVDERTWVFLELARQQGMDAAVLEVGGENKDAPRAGSSPQTSSLLVAVLIEGEAYLFDPRLGLPIPAVDGVVRDDDGRLTIQPATLAQAARGDRLLRQLDAPSHPYGLKAADFSRATVLLAASPEQLSLRMKLLESRLTGPQKMALTVSPSLQAAPWKSFERTAAPRLWLRPFETLLRRSHLSDAELNERLLSLLPFYAIPSSPLYHGRLLHLKGEFTGDNGAIRYYQLARPSNEELAASSIPGAEKFLYFRGKQDAGYWLGLVAFQRGNYSAAADYFAIRTLQATPNGPWTPGARYNLGRTFETLGDDRRAVVQYEEAADLPGGLGGLIRAKWLAERTGK
ncbi:MAG: hypothetical protein LLF97_00295 [Planctomycetaceae bacterium]|nr:hypothetical protein [Planctomycetaceae bacterium]